MELVKVRDILVYFSFTIILFAFTIDQVISNDEQWNKGTILLAPMFYFGVFSLSGVFYFRSTYFTVKSQSGPQFVNLDSSTGVKKSAFIRNILSWVFIILTLITLAEGVNYFQDSYESVEYAEDEDGMYDDSTVVEESKVVTKCKHNEECVAANILNDGYIFGFLAPNNMTFAEGDPTEYNQVTGILAPIWVIFLTWYSFCLISWIYCLALRKIPDEYSDYYWLITQSEIYVKSSVGFYWKTLNHSDLGLDFRRTIYDIGSSPSYIWIDVGTQILPVHPSGVKISEDKKIDESEFNLIQWGHYSRGRSGELLDISQYIMMDYWNVGLKSINDSEGNIIHPTVKLEDSNGDIWIGSEEGILLKGWTNSQRLEVLNSGPGTFFSTVFLKDNEGNWWFGDSPFMRRGKSYNSNFLNKNFILSHWYEYENK